MHEQKEPVAKQAEDKPLIINVGNGSAGGHGGAFWSKVLGTMFGTALMGIISSLLFGTAPRWLVWAMAGILGLVGWKLEPPKDVKDKAQSAFAKVENLADKFGKKVTAEVKEVKEQIKAKKKAVTAKWQKKRKEREKERQAELEQAKARQQEAKAKADEAALAKLEWEKKHGLNAQCPNCHIGFRIESWHLGKKQRCNKCKRMFSPHQAKTLGPPQQRPRLFGIRAS